MNEQAIKLQEEKTHQPQRKEIAQGQLLINGNWRDSQSGETMPTTDPTTEAVITEIAKATTDDANAAVDAAYEAFETGAWGKMHHEERAKSYSKWLIYLMNVPKISPFVKRWIWECRIRIFAILLCRIVRVCSDFSAVWRCRQ